MIRTWTEGEELQKKRNRIAAAIKRMEWKELKPTLLIGLPEGIGITAAIKQWDIPKVDFVAASNELAPYGLYGIQGNFLNGVAKIYFIDTGDTLVPVATDFKPKE